ncbi:MAG: SPOR domain-containing protein [Pseudomonadales bacterium]|nr:SPOR domain-containing protein [Pseudomonadales bacterium]
MRIEKRFFLQLVGFENLKEADAIASRLKSIEQIVYTPVILTRGNLDGYQVRVGPYKTRKETERLQALAVMYDISPLTIIEE